MFGVIIAIFVVALSMLYWYRRDKRLPPGPKGLPLLGVIPYLAGHSARKLTEWSKKYGSVYTARLGQRDYLVLTDYDVINEVLVKQGSKVEARPSLFIFDECAKGHGLIFAKQRVWVVHRPFVANTLRRLGMGTKVVENRITEETEFLIDAFRKKSGELFDPKDLFLHAVVNVAASVTMGQRFPYDDKEFKEVIHKLVRGWQEDGKYVILLGYCAYLRRLPMFRSVLKNFVSDFEFLNEALRKYIRDHEDTYDKNDIRDVIDAFIEESKKQRHDRTFNEDQLVVLVRDMLDAGAQTTTCTLLWLIVALVKYPQYQEKIRKEVDAVVEGNTVTASHREKMPMTIAFTNEVMRLCMMAAQSHVCTTDEVEVNGYKIPKNTPIFAVLWSVHNSPKYFENPAEFRPERFIDPINGTFVKSRYCNPFSVGKRACVGEQLAQMELFGFIVSIIQKFEISADDLTKVPNFDEGQYGIVYVPPRFKLRFTERAETLNQTV